MSFKLKFKVTDQRDKFHGKYLSDARGSYVLTYTGAGTYEVLSPTESRIVNPGLNYSDILECTKDGHWKIHDKDPNEEP